MKKESCHTPLVSVLMPAYNAENYIGEAIDSIIAQTYSNWELVIVNDASQDGTVDIVKKYQKLYPDREIKLYHNEENLGLASTLNKAKPFIQGEYVVRMDADDISRPERLEWSLEFLEQNPDIVMVGGSLERWGADWKDFIDTITYPLDVDGIRLLVFYGSPFSQPCLMIRNSFFQQDVFHYNSKFSVSEDYELWSRICFEVKTANLDRVLLDYRWHPASSSNAFHEIQQQQTNVIRANVARRFCPDWSDEKVSDYLKVMMGEQERFTREELERSLEAVEELAQAVKTEGSVNFTRFRDFLFFTRGQKIIENNLDLGLWLPIRMFWFCRALRFPLGFCLRWLVKITGQVMR